MTVPHVTVASGRAAPRSEIDPEPGSLGSLARVDLAAVAACGAQLRRVVREASSLEEAAQQVATHLHQAFGDEHGSCALLTRVFVTTRADELEDEVRALLDPGPDAAPCLALLATRGAVTDWDDRRQSQAHQVLALSSSDANPLAGMPMINGLFEQFGLVPDAFGQYAHRSAAADFSVFHVEEAAGSPLVPAQDFVHDFGVRSVLGVGCALADGRVIAVVQFTRVPLPAWRAQLFGALAVSLRLALLPLTDAPVFAGAATAPTVRPGAAAALEAAERHALEQLVTVLGDDLQRQAVELRSEAALVEELQRLGSELACELDLEALVALVVRSAVRTTGATVGVCVFDHVDADGDTRRGSHLLGLAEDAPTAAALVEMAELARLGEGVLRAEALALDGVGSYLAAPVVARCGRVLGAVLLGHPAPTAFGARAEALLVGIAGHAALGLDNARLFSHQRDAATELQRSLLPPDLPPRPGLSFDARYLPGGGVEATVGGDWYDVIGGEGRRTAMVVGDVMGRGLRAAAAMGQLRTALRVLLLAGHSAGEALERLDDLLQHLPGERIATCAVAVHDPGAHSLELVSAGHLPLLLLRPGHAPELVSGEPAGPLGALGQRPVPTTVAFPPGSSLLLFTDGLVERRSESIDVGLARLCDEVGQHRGQIDLDRLLEAVQRGLQDDDTALLLVQAHDGTGR